MPYVYTVYKPGELQHIARSVSPENLRLITQNLPLMSSHGLGNFPYPGEGLLIKLSLRPEPKSSGWRPRL